MKKKHWFLICEIIFAILTAIFAYYRSSVSLAWFGYTCFFAYKIHKLEKINNAEKGV